MFRTAMTAALAAAMSPALPAMAQDLPAPVIGGTRLDVVGTGEVQRVPDVAIVNAGVVTRAATATEALAANARRMEQVIAALRRAGVAARDIQTSSINLNPEYRYGENQPPELTGYQASNQVSVRFRDLERTGRILDALVAVGANQIHGPTLTLDDPEAALDEARQEALAEARARADLYARSLGMRVKRVVLVSETGGSSAPPPRPMPMMARESAADTPIVPGEQEVSASLLVSFELE